VLDAAPRGPIYSPDVVIQLGDLAEWAAAIGTAGSVAYLAVTRVHDQRDDHIRQARLVRVVMWEYSDEDPELITPQVEVANLSELQVVDLESTYPSRRHSLPYQLSTVATRDILAPGETWKTEGEEFRESDGTPRPEYVLTFTDAKGRRWKRVAGVSGDPQPVR